MSTFFAAIFIPSWESILITAGSLSYVSSPVAAYRTYHQGLSETPLPLRPTSRGAVPSHFNPDGRLLTVVFFVYGSKRREMLLRPLEADVVRHNRCWSHR